MKMVVAIIKPFRLNYVHNALFSIGVSGMTVSEAKGHGHQRGHAEIYGDIEYVANFIPKLRIEVIVPDDTVHATVQAIMTGARTGQSGDGKIYVYTLDQFMKIRTGETGRAAL